MKSNACRKMLFLLLGMLLLSSVAWAADEVELSVEQSVVVALQNNPDIQTAIAQQDYYKGALLGAKSALRPQVTFAQTSANQVNGKTRSYTSPENGFVSQLSLSQTIYSGGGLQANVTAAKAQLTQSDWALEQAKQTLRFDTQQDYYQVLNKRDLVDVNQTALDNLVEHLKNVQAQFDAGVVAKSDVLRSQVQVSNQQQQLIIAQNDFDTATVKLKTDLSLPLTTVVKLTSSQMDIRKNETTLDEALKVALENRPEIMQAKYAVEQNKAKIMAAKSGLLPAVNLQATDSSSGNEWPGSTDRSSRFGYYGDVGGSYGNGVTIQAVISYTIFDGGLIKSQIQQAKSGLVQAEQALIKQKNLVAQNVTVAYVSLLAAEKQIGTTKMAVDQGQEDFHIAQVRYSAGVGTNVDVLDAQKSLQTASANYVQAYANYNIARAALDKAMGIMVAY